MRIFAPGDGRKTDRVDAHSVALAALYSPPHPGLRPVVVEDDLVAMGMLVNRRDEPGRAWTCSINRARLEPAGADRDGPGRRRTAGF